MRISEQESKKIFFCADLHLSHSNIIKFCNRPFKDSNEMNEAIIKNWNETVPKDGTVFLLGDVGFGDAAELKVNLDRLNGKIYLIIGNHDNPATNQVCINRFSQFNEYRKDRYKDVLELLVEDKDAPKGIQKIVLYHYAIVDWNGKFHGSWTLHGHSHQTLHNTEIGKLLYQMKIIDVGVDGHNFKPLSYQQIKEIMSIRKNGF